MKKIVIAGGSGFLGKILADNFHKKGFSVVILTRGKSDFKDKIKYVNWDGENLGQWSDELTDADILINLSGRTVNCRYTQKNKDEIYASRLNSTKILGEVIKGLQRKPKLWINSSSATIYAHSNGEQNDENGKIGSGFSVDVCQKWENAFFSHEIPDIRRVCLRTSMVIGKNGPFLDLMTKIVKLRLGGRQGNGNQFVSWIHEKDFVDAIQFLIDREDLSGIFNLSAPNPVRNYEMMQLLRKACGVKIGLPALTPMVYIGAFIMRTEAELPLKSRNVIPKRLLDESFKFSFPEMSIALNDLIRN